LFVTINFLLHTVSCCCYRCSLSLSYSCDDY